MGQGSEDRDFKRNIVLVGLPGSGKTTVGELLARRGGRTLADTDLLVEQREGKTIPEIFRDLGEEGFREIESTVIREMVSRSRQVIATGGGVLKDPGNMRCLRSSGTLVWLDAGVEEIVRRIECQDHRPLLTGRDRHESLSQLYRDRLPLYRQADLRVDSSSRTPLEVAEEVERLLGEFWQERAEVRSEASSCGCARRVQVGLGERAYPVVVGDGLLGECGAFFQAFNPGRKVLIVSNPVVSRLYGEPVISSLHDAGYEPWPVEMADGEEFKNLETIARLYDRAVEAGLDRNSTVVALGGGVVGDAAGFVASTYMRGVNFVQLPTTLLAQVDASVGGKVAVNHPLAKNLIGAFHQPRLVICDVATLRSLPEREFRSGMAEVVKHGLIRARDYLEFVDIKLDRILALETEALVRVVADSCAIKAGVVEEDEREAGLRAILNFGHTVGHALETVTGYGCYRHGEAVSVGMVTAGLLSLDLGLLSRSHLDWMAGLLRRVGLPTDLKTGPAEAFSEPGTGSGVLAQVLSAMARDKKWKDGRARFVLLEGLGRAKVSEAVLPGMVEGALTRQLAGGGCG